MNLFSNEPSAKKEDLICEALYNYDKTRDDELQLYKGQKILILEESEDDWWRGRNLENGQDGWFPSNYVELVSFTGIFFENVLIFISA